MNGNSTENTGRNSPPNTAAPGGAREGDQLCGQADVQVGERAEPRAEPRAEARNPILARFDPREELDELARECAPGRLAICAVNEEEHDGLVLAWGMQYADGRVDLAPEHRRVRGSFRSLHQAMRVVGSGLPFPLHLVRIDPPPAAPEDEDEDEEAEAWAWDEDGEGPEERHGGRPEEHPAPVPEEQPVGRAEPEYVV